MSTPNLTGTVSGLAKLDSTRVNVTVEIEDPSVPEDQRVEGSAQTLTVPMPIDRAKSMGIGAKVELTLKKVAVPRAKKDSEAQAAGGEPEADGGDEDGQENDDPEPATAPVATPVTAAPAAGGRRRAASGPTA